ncbi:TRAP transporter substrate-binding protein DctP [Salibacterium halotolerans]|uniref:Tripartite ATP-independent transporter solute receptor, DctP family n=1 Tax=Salibacterium halotolerans TaxID=1884432 RepID=A0A1I5R072_9BACI|nr:TRAP transporter substrate-binding protein DctP [Salibacterium halotolerans]SFP51747.1 tripartite ATP-independent transporter solute receptor, DctP family [Salibacterium halotolerans]
MKKSKFKWLLGTALSSSLVLTACGGGGSEESSGDSGGDAGGNSGGGGEEEAAGGETYEWRFVTEESQGQMQYEYASEFASRLEEKSDGQISIEVFEFGGLGTEVDQVGQLQSGAVEMAIISPGFTGTMVEEGQVFALQFLLPDNQEDVHQLLETSEALNEDLAALYEEQNIMPLSFFTEGFMQWTGNKKLVEPSDFEGFTMRTQNSPLIQQSYGQYGADATVMSAGDLYTGLQNGTVDGQENPIFFIADSSYHEVQDHMTISNHNSYVAMMTVNPGFYNGLPEEIQGMIDETVEEMRDVGFDIQDELNSKLLSDIKNNEDTPTEVTELTSEQRDAFRELAMPMRDYYRENAGDQAGAILDKLESEIAEINEGS